MRPEVLTVNQDLTLHQRAEAFAFAFPPPKGSGIQQEERLSSDVPFTALLDFGQPAGSSSKGLQLGHPINPKILHVWMRLIQADKYVAGAGASSQLSCTVLITQSMYVTIITVALPVTT